MHIYIYIYIFIKRILDGGARKWAPEGATPEMIDATEWGRRRGAHWARRGTRVVKFSDGKALAIC